MRKLLICGVSLGAVTASPVLAMQVKAGEREWPADPPSAAAQGECYARVRIPAEFDAYSERVTTADAYEDYISTPAHLRPEVREYISRDAGMRYIVHEPVYETVTETVQIRPAYSEYVVHPAQTETVTESIMVREPRLVWRRGYVPGARSTRVDEETGDIWCLVEVPGEYQTVERTVVTRQGSVEEISYPAEYSTITRDVLVQAARVEEVPIPAEYDQYTVQVLDQAATVDRRYYEERTDSITRYSLRTNERFEWRMVDCEEIDIPSLGHQPVAEAPHAPMQQPVASASTTNSYVYGTDHQVDDQYYDEEVPVAHARSASTRRRGSWSARQN